MPNTCCITPLRQTIACREDYLVMIHYSFTKRGENRMSCSGAAAGCRLMFCPAYVHLCMLSVYVRCGKLVRMQTGEHKCVHRTRLSLERSVGVPSVALGAALILAVPGTENGVGGPQITAPVSPAYDNIPVRPLPTCRPLVNPRPLSDCPVGSPRCL